MVRGRMYNYVRGPVEKRFWAKVEKTGSCWLWLGAKVGNGYGQINLDGHRRVYAHRLSWELAHGAIQEGLDIDHLCRNRGCVNPAHMEVVTNRTNVLRGTGPTAANARKTECKRGHPLSGENLFRYKDGRRDCRTCMRLRRAA